jgi:hypothetical protein
MLSVKKKGLIISLSVLLVLCFTVGATLAWLLDTTEPVVNTFTPSDINITLTETTGPEYKMVPGTYIAKDPKVTVLEGSEPCYLYVEVIKAAPADDYLTVTMAPGWVNIGGTNIWYYNGTIALGTPISVLANDQVYVKDSVTKGMMENLKVTNATLPKITFKAYAVQKEAGASAQAAWNNTYGA